MVGLFKWTGWDLSPCGNIKATKQCLVWNEHVEDKQFNILSPETRGKFTVFYLSRGVFFIPWESAMKYKSVK